MAAGSEQERVRYVCRGPCEVESPAGHHGRRIWSRGARAAMPRCTCRRIVFHLLASVVCKGGMIAERQLGPQLIKIREGVRADAARHPRRTRHPTHGSS